MKNAVTFILCLLCLPISFALANEKTSGEYNNPAQPVEVAVGQEFRLVLDSNPTTGYRWQLASPLKKEIITLVNTEYKGSAAGLVGSGGMEIWTFRAEGKGNAELTMKYVRPWEKDAVPAKSLTFKVVVSQRSLNP